MLRGPDGVSKSLVQRSWEAARAVSAADRVVVATDDARIEEAALGFGAEVVMTDAAARNGTERCADALARLGETPEIVINLQGDAPLTPSWFVDAVIEAMRDDPSVQTATPAVRCDGASLTRFREDRRAGRVGGTTVVVGRSGDALYFSKEVLPFTEATYEDAAPTPVLHHVGLYGYRPEALKAYVAAEPCALETLEGLEQLRFLDLGVAMRVVEVAARGRVFWELNNPVDVARIEAALAEMAQA